MTDSKQPSLSKPISFDVIIAGGAMAGATLALALHQLSQGKLKVAVIEAFATDHSAHPDLMPAVLRCPMAQCRSCKICNSGRVCTLLRHRLNIFMYRINPMRG